MDLTGKHSSYIIKQENKNVTRNTRHVQDAPLSGPIL